MKVIVCVDENNGMLFNKRRVSKDRVIINDIEENIEIINVLEFSEKLFNKNINVVSNLTDGYNFVETNSLKGLEKEINEIILYNFNRKYPSDLKLEIDLAKYKKVEESEFIGSSHEKITKTIYKGV